MPALRRTQASSLHVMLQESKSDWPYRIWALGVARSLLAALGIETSISPGAEKLGIVLKLLIGLRDLRLRGVPRRSPLTGCTVGGTLPWSRRMPEDQLKIQAVFYRTAKEAEPVRQWLRGLSAEDRKIIGRDIARVQYGWPVGMPTCRPLGDGLYEVRSNLPRRIARVLFCLEDGRLVLLHGFFKTTQKTPPSDLAIARSRQKDVQR